MITAVQQPNILSPHTQLSMHDRYQLTAGRGSFSAASPTSDMISLFPEEILLYVLSLLDISDLYSSCLVSTVWRRLCEDEFIYRAICAKSFPCLSDLVHPPFEDTWKHFYTARKSCFAVIGGPISQAACMDDICNKLRAAGLPHVDGIFAQKRIPTLAELQKYCGVLVYSYNSSAFLDGSLMGDLLADYVDNGGGVVVSVFTNCNNLRNGFLKGRFLEGNYHPIQPARQHDTNGKRPLTLGRIHEPNHPIMAQVKTLDGGKSSFFCPGAIQAGGRLIADWSNGVPLAVDLPKGKGNVVGLNFFPPSCDTGDPRFWNSNSDGAIVLANALAHAGRSNVLRKRRAPSKRHLDYSSAKSDGASEDMVRDAQGNWVKAPLYRTPSSPRLRPSQDPPKKKKSLPARIFGKRLFSKWLSFRKSESS